MHKNKALQVRQERLPHLQEKHSSQDQLFLCECSAWPVPPEQIQRPKSTFWLKKTYEERLVSTRKALYPKGIKWLDDFKKWFKEMTPWIIICVLLYHLVNVKINVFAFSIEKYKKKALEIANSIKGE